MSDFNAGVRAAAEAVNTARETVIYSGERRYIDGISKGHDRSVAAILALIRPEAEAPAPEPVAWTEAAADVLAERARQISAEGWTLGHDDEHARGEMAVAAATYALAGAANRAERSVMDQFGSASATPRQLLDMWPWSISWWKPKNRRCDLVKAGALILAEIERLDRVTEGDARWL